MSADGPPTDAADRIGGRPATEPVGSRRERPRRDRAALALDVVVAVAAAVAALRLVELLLSPGLQLRAAGYGLGWAAAVALWLVWRRESRRPEVSESTLGRVAVAFTVITGSLFFVGDQPLPLLLFVVGLIMLLRSFRVRAGLFAVAALLVTQAVLFLADGRPWDRTLLELLASALLFGFGLLIAWLFAEVDRQRRDNAALVAELRRRAGSDAELALLQERQRSARDLHDGIGHQVTVIMMSLQFAERMRDREPQRAWTEISRAREQAAAALSDIRRLARALHPRGVGPAGSVDLAALAASFEGTGLEVEVSDHAVGLALPDDLAVFRRRFVQETLTNVVRHAGATRVAITQEVADGLLRLTVQDDGGAIEPVRPGFGLQSLDERAAELGGRTDVRTEDDGVEVTATVPVPESRS
jgi:signal transduction histidine kinase